MTDRELCVVSAVGSDYAGGGSGSDLQGESIHFASAEERSCWLFSPPPRPPPAKRKKKIMAKHVKTIAKASALLCVRCARWERHREAEKERGTKITVNNCCAKRFVSFCHFASFRSKSKSLRFAMKPQSLKLSFQFDILVKPHSALHASRGFHTICSITTHFAEPYLLPFTFASVIVADKTTKMQNCGQKYDFLKRCLPSSHRIHETKFKYQQKLFRGAWRDRDTNDIFAHCSLIFCFLDFKFPTLFVLLSFILWSGSFQKFLQEKEKYPKYRPKTPKIDPSIFIVLSIVLKLGTPLLHTQAQNKLLQNFYFTLKVEIWTKNLKKPCFTLPGWIWRNFFRRSKLKNL